MEFISPYGADGDLLPLEYTHSTSTKTDYDEYAYYYLSNNENNKHIVFGLKLIMTLQLKSDKSGFTLEVIPTDFEKVKLWMELDLEEIGMKLFLELAILTYMTLYMMYQHYQLHLHLKIMQQLFAIYY